MWMYGEMLFCVGRDVMIYDLSNLSKQTKQSTINGESRREEKWKQRYKQEGRNKVARNQHKFLFNLRRYHVFFQSLETNQTKHHQWDN